MLIGLIFISVTFSALSYLILWWLPCIVFPICMSIGFILVGFMPESIKFHPIYDFLFYVVIETGYVISQCIIFQKNIGSWYGWLVGGLISFVLAGVLAGFREHYQIFGVDVDDERDLEIFLDLSNEQFKEHLKREIVRIFK